MNGYYIIFERVDEIFVVVDSYFSVNESCQYTINGLCSLEFHLLQIGYLAWHCQSVVLLPLHVKASDDIIHASNNQLLFKPNEPNRFRLNAIMHISHLPIPYHNNLSIPLSHEYPIFNIELSSAVNEDRNTLELNLFFNSCASVV